MKICFDNRRLVPALLAATAMMTACHETDVYDPDRAAREYAANWTGKFGAVDPAQDWNMATQVTATVGTALPPAGGELRIYTDNPFTTNSGRLLARTAVSAATPSVSFDVAKDLTQVYATVRVGRHLAASGFYNIDGGRVTVGGAPAARAARRAAAPRRLGEACPVTVGGKVTLSSATYTPDAGAVTESTPFYVWSKDNTFKMVNGVIYLYSGGQWVKGTLDSEGFWCFNGVRNGALQYSGAWNSQTKTLDRQKTTPIGFYPDFYKLDNVAATAAQPWKLGQCYGLFGPEKFFAEQCVYWSDAKKQLEGYDVDKIERGAAITTEGETEIQLPLIYGGTVNANVFGYFYYRDGQDPAAAPRYILIGDARPSKNIFRDADRTQAISSDNGLPKEVGDLQYYQEGTEAYDNCAATMYYGSTYRAVYFGDSYGDPASYTFPAGVHIEFFVMNVGSIDNPTYRCDPGYFNYGTPALNKEIGHYYGPFNHYTGQQPEDKSRGAMKAAMWNYNGNVYMGFEDGGNDEDLNDMVFLVKGSIDTDSVIEVPGDDPAAQPEEWIVACEDLGSTDDYDFNDVVFSVSHVAGETTATVTPLAAGGTLPANICHGAGTLGEIHALIDPKAPANTMLNTESRGAAGQPLTVTVDANFSMADNMGGFSVAVQGEEAVTITAPAKGSVPQMICVPGTWAWPLERVGIEKAYPAFAGWNQSAGQNTEWYRNAEAGKVVR